MRKVRISRVVMLSILVPLAASCASAREPSLKSPSAAAVGSDPTPGGRPSLSEQRRRQFEERRASGRGVFFTPEEIRSAKASTLVTLLRRVPSVRVVCHAAGCVVSMSRATGECSPALLLDGHSAPYSTDVSMSTADVIGIEIYRTSSETPLEFLGIEQSCGTIVIWTRSGP